ncbi:MAG: mevalonate kinase [Deltaproteobacteria bacterium]|nr:mevalonate kinase [Deltaproteobacteria bacterium]
MLSAFGPGKVILLGEHGVVYGHPALAAPLQAGVTAHGTPSSRCELVMPEGAPPDAARLLRAAFAQLADGLGHPPLRVTLQSDLPLSQGLGSSGALAVACARLLLQVKTGRPAKTVDVERWAWAMERAFHGTPSGVDHTTSARGQLLYYRKAPAAEVGRARAVTGPRRLQLLVALAGPRTGTKQTVAALRARAGQWPRRYERVFRGIGALVDEARAAVEAGDAASLGDLMNMNHGMLAGLGLSSETLDGMVHRLRGLGALGAKLSGAGGDGGAVIGLFEDAEAAAKVLRRRRVPCFTSVIAGRGA